MPSKNEYYSKVILNDNAATDDSLAGREIQVIIGSATKMAESDLIALASEITRHTRMNQGWSTVQTTVESMDQQELPPLGAPTHTEGGVNTWIVE